jgi:hypothetical protein
MLPLSITGFPRNDLSGGLFNERMQSHKTSMSIVTLLPAVLCLNDKTIGFASIMWRCSDSSMQDTRNNIEELVKRHFQSGF